MRRFFTLAALLFALAAAGSTLHAQVQFGVGLPFRTDGSDIGIQGRVEIGLPSNLSIVPNLSFFFIENGTFFTVDGDLHYRILPTAGKTSGLYILGGLDIGIFSSDLGDATELGLNLGTGFKGDVGSVDLFGELKFVVGDFDTVVLTGGVLF